MSPEPVGSLAEEAAKLIAVVQGWAADADSEPNRDDRAAADDAAHADESAHADHTAHGDHGSAAECRWCPLCQLARAAKATTPEVREHLTSAAMSLALAFKGLMDGIEVPAGRDEPVEKIDLDFDSAED